MKAAIILLSTLIAIGCVYSIAYETHYCTYEWYCQANIMMFVVGTVASLCGILYAMIEVK